MTTWSNKLQHSIQQAVTMPFVSMTLCTVSTLAGGAPRGRTVVLRAVSEREIAICTKTTSSKWTELAQDARFELCIYLADTREQYRLRGNVVRMQTKAEAMHIWQALSPNARNEFGPDSDATFGVIWFTPNLAVELLDLRTNVTITDW